MLPRLGGVMLAEDLRIEEDAFEHTADPKFCYLDPLRRHASARLLSGLYEGDGLFSLTGRAGIGKTILLRHLSEQLNALDGVLPLCPMHVFACRTGTTLADVLGACESSLGLGQSAAEPLKAAKKLQQLVQSNRSPVLLLDDADLLGDDVLEVLVTLTGLQAADRCLLSVVLAGHTGVATRVATITGNGGGPASDRAVELQPMAEPDVARLISHRLRAAGRAEETFRADAIARIVRHSGGVPLAIVSTCRRALQIAESRSRKAVTADIAAEAIGEEGSGVHRGSTRLAAAPVAPATPGAPAESSAARAALPASVEPKVAFSVPAEPKPASPALAEPRPAALAPEARQVQPPSGLKSSAGTSAGPSLRREPHASIPGVTVGHHAPSALQQGLSDSPPAASREEAWWLNIVDETPVERTTRDSQMGRRRRRGKRVTLKIVGSVLFVALIAAALAVFMGGLQELSERIGTSSTAGAGGGLGMPPGYDARANAEAWWRPGMQRDSLAPGAAFDKDAGKAETSGQKSLPGLTSLEVGRLRNPVVSPPATTPGENEFSRLADGAAPPVSSAAPIIPESISRGEVMPPSSPADAKAEPQPEPSAPPAPGEPQWKPPSPPQKAEAQPNPAVPATRPAAPAAKLLMPQTRPAATGAKAAAPRNREIETLLAEGDARLDEGDLAAARSVYEQAYDRGSAAAAVRMAQTFDPRNVAATRKTASPAEAILWYQDAARKGDRRAKTELDDLASWLENSAASGNQEARRVLDLWQEPAAPTAEEPTQ